jgi:hypothetical protein
MRATHAYNYHSYPCTISLDKQRVLVVVAHHLCTHIGGLHTDQPEYEVSVSVKLRLRPAHASPALLNQHASVHVASMPPEAIAHLMSSNCVSINFLSIMNS